MSTVIYRPDSGDEKEIQFRGTWYMFFLDEGRLYARRKDYKQPDERELSVLFHYLRHEGWSVDELDPF